MKNSKLVLGCVAGLVLGIAGTGCGSKQSTPNPIPTVTATPVSGGNPTIVVVNGYRGYYKNNQFCDSANNYCGTGLAYGIVVPPIIVLNGYQGYYSNNVFCNLVNNYCGTGLSWGVAVPVIIIHNNYYGYYVNNVFCDYANNYCGTDISWGISNNGTYCDYNYCGGSSGSTGGYRAHRW